MGVTRKEKKYSTTQKKIMDATLSLVSENGYHKTTTKEIATRAGVNESTMYRTFKGKEDIFLAVKEKEGEEMSKAWEKFMEKEFSSLDELIDSSVVFIYKLFLKHHDMLLIMIKEIHNKEIMMDKNSVFEESINNLSVVLSDYTNTKKDMFLSEVFMFVSSMIFLVVNKRNENLLMDEFDRDINTNDISEIFKKTIKMKVGGM